MGFPDKKEKQKKSSIHEKGSQSSAKSQRLLTSDRKYHSGIHKGVISKWYFQKTLLIGGLDTLNTLLFGKGLATVF